MNKLDLSQYRNQLSFKHQIIRFLWGIVWGVFARPLPKSIGSSWKRFLLRLFGAKIDSTAIVYSSALIYYPKNLIMGPYSCIASDVTCYNVDLVTLEDNCTVSQGAHLCTASHNITKTDNPLIVLPIIIKSKSWIAADAFVGMGVTIGEGADRQSTRLNSSHMQTARMPSAA